MQERDHGLCYVKTALLQGRMLCKECCFSKEERMMLDTRLARNRYDDDAGDACQ